MDDMDIDSIVDVPDTPDRLKAQTKKGKRSMERGSNLSASSHSGHCNYFVDDARNGQKASDMVSRKFSVHAPKSSSTKYDSCSKLAFASGNSSTSSSSSNNSLIFRRVRGDASNYENKHFQADNNKMSYAQSPVVHVVDLAEQNGHVQVGKRVNPCTVQGNSRVEGYGRVPFSTSRLPSSSGMPNSVMTSDSGNKGKEPPIKTSDMDCDGVVGSLAETQPKAVKDIVPTSLNNVSSSRVTGQKRLVRNGCISPHNIAKVKQEVGMNKNGNIYVAPHHALSMVSGGLKESTTEHMDSRKSKGKGIMASHPSSVEEFDAQKMQNRNSVCINELVKEVGVQELGGWRSTRNQSKKMHFPVSDGHQDHSTESDDLCLVNQLPGNGATGRKIGNGSETTNSFPMCQDPTSGQCASLPPPKLRLSNQPELDKQKGNQSAKGVLAKRQRQGPSSSSRGESSSAAMGDSDVMFLGSSGTSKSSLTQTRNRNSLAILEPIIEIDEASPEVRGDGFSAASGSATATDAMARQIEADEMLARELQEQLYNEVPGVGVGEDDAYMAMALQQEESSTPAFPRRSHHVFSPRNSSGSTRHSQLRPLLNTSRRSSQARGPAPNRMARLRGRFPGRPRTISSSREGNPVFPPDMDVDMRMYILEALEAFSDMGVDNSFLQAQREFNEDDYETLLALDENNHLHGGATDHQINGLPQSTVQSDNFEEPCAICLETPTIGDMIRHLPCLHKFHKDCIDLWLRRKTSCPVCKSSIT